jgi:hypothetical protein
MKLEWATRYDDKGDIVGFWQAGTNGYEFVAEGSTPLEASMALNLILIDQMGL